LLLFGEVFQWDMTFCLYCICIKSFDTSCGVIAPDGGIQLSGRPSRVRQREIQQIVRGAMKAGAKQVEIQVGDARVIVPLCPQDEKPVETGEEISL
jgi:hypothetical protein